MFRRLMLAMKKKNTKKSRNRRGTCEAMISQTFVAFKSVIHMSSQSAALSVSSVIAHSLSLRQPGMSSKPQKFSLS